MIRSLHPDLENRLENPKFIKPFEYGYHNLVDLISEGMRIQAAEYYAIASHSPWNEYAQTSIGDMFCFYDPKKVHPSDNIMFNIKFEPGRMSESVNAYGIHTVTTILAQTEISKEIKGLVVADLGSGEGIQSLAALKLGASHVILYESNPAAIAQAKKLLQMNDIMPDRYTIILDTLNNAYKYKTELSRANIGVANIGAWKEQYGDAHLNAIEVSKYAPNMKYYIAGGHRYARFGGDDKQSWYESEKAKGEDDVIELLAMQGFLLVNKSDGHHRESMNCSRAFIAKRSSVR